MSEHIAAALKSLGQVTVDSVLPAFEDSPTLIARGTLSKANAEAVSAFRHSSLQFSFHGPAAGTDLTYSFHVYFDPSQLTSAGSEANAPEASAKAAKSHSK